MLVSGGFLIIMIYFQITTKQILFYFHKYAIILYYINYQVRSNNWSHLYLKFRFRTKYFSAQIFGSYKIFSEI